jgi:hypothetical protein
MNDLGWKSPETHHLRCLRYKPLYLIIVHSRLSPPSMARLTLLTWFTEWRCCEHLGPAASAWLSLVEPVRPNPEGSLLLRALAAKLTADGLPTPAIRLSVSRRPRRRKRGCQRPAPAKGPSTGGQTAIEPSARARAPAFHAPSRQLTV